MSPKTKNILLVVGFMITLVICYRLAVAKTIEQHKLYSQLKQEQTLFDNMPKQLAQLNHKKKFYDSILDVYQIKGSSVQNNLIQTINVFSKEKGVKIVDFGEPHLQQKDDILIKTYQFILEGDFQSLNGLIYQLEQKTKFGEIINVHFEKKKDLRTGKQFLQATVLLKSFG